MMMRVVGMGMGMEITQPASRLRSLRARSMFYPRDQPFGIWLA